MTRRCQPNIRVATAEADHRNQTEYVGRQPGLWPRPCRIAIALVTVFVATSTTMQRDVLAADLNPAHVPVDAKWLIHLDQEKLYSLDLIEKLRSMYPETESTIREWFQKRYGIDPQTDLRSITMFSRDYRIYTGTVLLQTNYDRETLLSMIHDHGNVTTTDWNGHTLYTVTLAKHHQPDADAAQHASERRAHTEHFDSAASQEASHTHDLSGGKQMTICLDDELIVLASSVPDAQAALRLLTGQAESLEGSGSPLLTHAPPGAVIYGAAIDLALLKQQTLLLPLLQQQNQCVYAFGEQNGRLFETLTLMSQTDEIARRTAEVLEGLIAYERLCSAGSEPLTQMMANVQLSRDGLTTHVKWEGDTEQVVSAFDDLERRILQWTKLFAE